ncbi:PA2169 family four-helix-bundle protein [Pseudoalteromonas peptidolytica]|uniref:PA2169 family four-helix-bundle protein n=1 Tax=Pseudoalteromonas peptidolytica TaxID=61150 RepID=UPI00298D69FA|nr:PA2169 family four-helix-bundle protein [Pseudoalteromonas peptidolytica]MDW7547782.1 PA2169 family four-helix-bundle protein [Pseudoalteromonas peptidolytica]
MAESNYDLEPVKALIKVLNGGVEFYTEAKKKLDDIELSRIFDQMIVDKAQAISDLQPFVLIDEGEIETDTALSVDIRESYTKLVGVVSTDKAHTYISQLEEVEDKVLKKLDEALSKALPPKCKSTLLQIQVQMQACHDQMKQLQELTA